MPLFVRGSITPLLSRRVRLLVRWSAVSAIGIAVVVVVVALSARSRRVVVAPAGAQLEGLTSVLSRELGRQDVPIRFEDCSAALDPAFRYYPAPRSSLIAEDMGGGLAWGDFDNDGLCDLFVVNFAGPVLPGAAKDPQAGRCRLYRNLGGGRFEDVTDRVDLHFAGFGLAAAWGDYDSDGDLDLYVTGYEDNALFENVLEGGGAGRTSRFRDVTDRAGVQDRRFSAGCSWADYDRDGDLDLYVCNYVQFTFRESDRALRDPQYAEQPWTLNPNAYPPLPNALFRNNGDGTFTDVAGPAGVTDPEGRGLGAAWADLDNDGWPDLYVANDVSKNAVFRNRGDGTFEDIGAASLAADYRSAMGMAVADFDDDLDLDLVITHWIAQENALYRNMLLDAAHGRSAGGLWFVDAADQLGLGQIALDMVGWATGFADFDNDGLLDLWLVNGHTFEQVENDRRVLIPQPPFLFWNRGQEGFVDVAPRTCPSLSRPFVGRGGAQADFDGDGRVDLALLVHSGPVMLLRNLSTVEHHWLRIALRQRRGNTFAIGARVYVAAGGRTRMAEVGCSPSYLSQNELTLHFGLGACDTVESVRIVWPDQRQETHRDVPVDRELLVTRDSD